MSRKILITGGAGLIGKRVAEKHLEMGDDVYIYDDLSNPYNDYSEIIGKNLYGQGLKHIIRSYKFDIISHHAARVGVGQSQYEIGKYFGNNVQFTAILLQAMVDMDTFPKQLILASSMGPYGEGQYKCNNYVTVLEGQREEINPHCICGEELIPLRSLESAIRIPQSMYALTKMTQEEMFRIFAYTYSVPTIALRYFSVYSTTSNPLNPYTGVLSIIANKILTSSEIELNEDGLQTRDLIHVNDVANAHYLATKVKFYDNFVPLNICTEKSVTLKYVAEKMKKLLKSNKKIVTNGKIRKGDIRHSRGRSVSARYFLDWNPKIDIDLGIKLYCDYIISHMDEFEKLDTAKIETENLEKRGLMV